MALDPNVEWLGHVQPTGLVVAPVVLARHGLVPEEQRRSDTDEAAGYLAGDGPALPQPWPFFRDVLGWDPARPCCTAQGYGRNYPSPPVAFRRCGRRSGVRTPAGG